MNDTMLERLVKAAERASHAFALYADTRAKEYALAEKSVELREQELQAFNRAQETNRKMADGFEAVGRAHQKIADK